ncbi:MAG: FlgD immunoglobulin-like domain containing protein [Candidatus Kapaibacterium sp.]
MIRFYSSSLSRFGSLLFLIAITFVPIHALHAQSTHRQEVKTLHDERLNREDDDEFREGREEWIRSMHRAEPGLNWEVINREVRMARQAELARMREEKYKSGSLRPELLGSDTVGGILRGHWVERGSNNLAGSMATADVDFERGLIYAASAGGNIWRGTLDGKNWTCLNNAMNFPNTRMVKLLKNDSLRRILVVTGSSAIYYSDNEGATWSRSDSLATIAQWGWFTRGVVASDPGHTIYALGIEWDYKQWKSVSTLYRSTDLGRSFKNIARFDDNRADLWGGITPDCPIYLLYGDTLARVMPSDSIVTIAPKLAIPGGNDGIDSYILLGRDSRTLILDVIRHNASEIFASGDGGKSWVRRGSVDVTPNRNAFALSLTDPNVMITGGVEAKRSSDGGATWESVNGWGEYYGDPGTKLHADIQAVTVFPKPGGGELMLISNDGGIYRSDDIAMSVNNISLEGLGVSQYYSTYTCRADTNFIYVGSQDQGFQRSLSLGAGRFNFEQTISGDYGHITSGNGGQSIWTVYPGFAMYYDSLTISTRAKFWSFTCKGQLWMPPILADTKSPNVAYLAGGSSDSGAYIYRLIAGNDSIDAKRLPHDFSGGAPSVNITSLGISPIDPNHRYVMTSDGGFHHTSGGVDGVWQRTDSFNVPGSHYFYGACILPSPVKKGRVYIAGSGYSNPAVYVTNDDGVTFDTMNVGLPRTLVFELAGTPDDRFLFAATDAGPYVYIASRGRWYSAAGLDAPAQTYWCVDYVPELKTARFGTYGRGLWDFTIDEFPAGVETAAAPLGLQLTAEPNIVADGTTISLTMPRSGHATLRVYDITGRVVSELNDGDLAAGTHRFYWDGTAHGHRLPAGTYLCSAGAFGSATFTRLTVVR